jgi:DNA-binding protein YbaB
MAREIDEAWIDEAIDRYRRIEAAQAELDKAVASTEVTVHSPDATVEVVVCADGEIRDVRIRGSLQHRSAAELSRSVQATIASAATAAQWARQKLHDEAFGGYRPLGDAGSGGYRPLGDAGFGGYRPPGER